MEVFLFRDWTLGWVGPKFSYFYLGLGWMGLNFTWAGLILIKTLVLLFRFGSIFIPHTFLSCVKWKDTQPIEWIWLGPRKSVQITRDELDNFLVLKRFRIITESLSWMFQSRCDVGNGLIHSSSYFPRLSGSWTTNGGWWHSYDLLICKAQRYYTGTVDVWILWKCNQHF